MKRAIDETNRRRALQSSYNKKHHITPKSVEKKIASIVDHELKPDLPKETLTFSSAQELSRHIKQREKNMREAAKQLNFEQATIIRDEIYQLRKIQRG